jgi:transposase
MNDRTRRSFDKEFKKMVVELHKSGKSSNEIGRELGIPGDMVRRWSREYESHGDQSFAGNGKLILSTEQREIAELKKAKSKGYYITLIFFWLDSVELAKDRVQKIGFNRE